MTSAEKLNVIKRWTTSFEIIIFKAPSSGTLLNYGRFSTGYNHNGDAAFMETGDHYSNSGVINETYGLVSTIVQNICKVTK